jgi:hypothetical protein
VLVGELYKKLREEKKRSESICYGSASFPSLKKLPAPHLYPSFLSNSEPGTRKSRGTPLRSRGDLSRTSRTGGSLLPTSWHEKQVFNLRNYLM